MPTFFEILLRTNSMCLFHFKLDDSMTPRNLESHCTSSGILLIKSLAVNFFLWLNIIYDVFLTFRESLFD